MSSESTRLGFSQQYLRDEYLSAVNDLTNSFDDCAASYEVLRRVAALTGSGAAFLCVATHKRSVAQEQTVVVARTGNFFTDVATFSEMQTSAVAYGWNDTREKFRCTLKSNGVVPERFLVGYPLFDKTGNHVGVLMLVIFSEESIQILEELCPTLIYLLMHRIREFNLIDDLTKKGDQEARDILAVRGTRFPSVSEFIYMGLHTINGQLAVASLQTRVLKGEGVSVDERGVGLDRIEKSLIHAGDKISAQDDMVSMILGRESSCSFVQSFDFALTTFGQGLKINVEFDVTHQIPQTATIPLRGNVAHWIFHNILRAVIRSDQWLPETLIGTIPIETKARLIPDRDSPGFITRLPSHPLVLEYLAEITNFQPSTFTHQRLPGMVSLLCEILSVCGGGFSYSQDQKMVDIVVLLPIPQLVTQYDAK